MTRILVPSCLVGVALAGLAMACAEPPAQDASDLTQFPAASSVPPLQAPPASSASDDLWPDASVGGSKK